MNDRKIICNNCGWGNSAHNNYAKNVISLYVV